jgi:hypothetical protein
LLARLAGRITQIGTEKNMLLVIAHTDSEED